MQIFGADPFSMAPTVHGHGRAAGFGFIYGLGYDDDLSSVGEAVLRGKAFFIPAFTQDDFGWSVFADGERIAVQESVDSVQVPAASANDFLRRVDVLGHLRGEDIFDDLPLFSAVPVGDNVRLTWVDIPGAIDFAEYVIYELLGGGPYTYVEIDTVRDRNVLTYSVLDVSVGEHEYAITYRDVHGNELAVTDAKRVTVTAVVPPTPPLDVDAGPTSGFTGAADRLHTFTVTPPADLTGIVGYLWAWNQSALDGEIPFPNTDRQWQHYEAVGSNDLTLAMYAGNWTVQVATVNKEGIQSRPIVSKFSLVEETNGDLTAVSSIPIRIVEITAQPRADGDIEIEFWDRYLDQAPGTKVAVFRDGAKIGEKAIVAGAQRYLYTDAGSGLVHDTEYEYHVAPIIEGGTAERYVEASPTVSAKADKEAPSGDQVLAGEIFF